MGGGGISRELTNYEALLVPNWYLISHILARDNFAGFYFRDFNTQI